MDALRMRCRRLCEKKGTGKSHVDSSVSEIYKNGGPGREVLEMALLECLAKYGTGRQNYKKIKAIQRHQSTYIGPIYSPLHGGSITILYYISIYIYKIARWSTRWFDTLYHCSLRQSSSPSASMFVREWKAVSQNSQAFGWQKRPWESQESGAQVPSRTSPVTARNSLRICAGSALRVMLG